MNEILYVLRKSHVQSESEIAKLLKVPIAFYKKIEAGEVDLTFDQSKILGEHFNIDPSFFPLKKNSVVNYNAGNSYTLVINPTHFYAQPTKEQLEANKNSK